MLNTLPITIGLRYLRAKRSNAFISFVSLFAFLGMALGVFALIVVLSVMNGFDRELKERILRTVPHGFIRPEGGLADPQALMARLASTPHLLGLAPYVQTNGLLTYAGNARGVNVVGVDPAYEGRVSDVEDFMAHGELATLSA
ncbi:MAG TPA: ABC transporter permease, partial [Marinagarivorans sp.]